MVHSYQPDPALSSLLPSSRSLHDLVYSPSYLLRRFIDDEPLISIAAAKA